MVWCLNGRSGLTCYRSNSDWMERKMFTQSLWLKVWRAGARNPTPQRSPQRHIQGCVDTGVQPTEGPLLWAQTPPTSCPPLVLWQRSRAQPGWLGLAGCCSGLWDRARQLRVKPGAQEACWRATQKVGGSCQLSSVLQCPHSPGCEASNMLSGPCLSNAIKPPHVYKQNIYHEFQVKIWREFKIQCIVINYTSQW